MALTALNPVAGPTVSLSYLDSCRALIQRGHSKIAVQQLNAYLGQVPMDADALALLGQAKRALGKVDDAKAAFLSADLADPANISARLLHAEMLVELDDRPGALDVLYEAAEQRPVDARVLQEIATLVEAPEDYRRLRRQWMAGRMNGMTAAGGARAVAKGAALVGAFADAVDIYRWLIGRDLERIRKDKAANVVRPEKASAGRVGGGRGEQALRDLKALMTEQKAPFFLISGTLLGYLREGALLPGDKDLDVGVFRADYDHARLISAFRRSPLFEVRRLDNLDRLRVAHANGVWIDIFPHYREGDRIWHDGTASRWWNTPFEIGTLTIKGEEYAVPEPPERYLDENYGDWRTPNAMFDVRYEAPNAEVRSQDYLHLLIYTRVFEALNGSKWAVIQKYERDFPDLFGADALLQQAAREAGEITAHLAATELAVRQGQQPPRFPEAVQAARIAEEEHAQASPAGAAPGAPPRRNPNHVRVKKWFLKRWRRVFGPPPAP